MDGNNLQIKLLGCFRLIYEGKDVNISCSPRTQALLTYLIIHKGVPQSREHISYLFWPTTSQQQAKTNLRQLLHHLKSTIPQLENHIVAEHWTLHWKENESCTVDFIEFEKLISKIKKARNNENLHELKDILESAVNTYKGDLLPTCFEDWLLQTRDYLSRKFFWVLEILIEILIEEGDFSTAILYAHKLLLEDNLTESVYGQLMRLYFLRNDRSSAIRIYDLCSQTLEMELGVKPGSEVQKIYREILG